MNIYVYVTFRQTNEQSINQTITVISLETLENNKAI